ncbi:hypothetical protein CBL_08577 [Carabus blaptoides fortunei]
MGFSMCTTVTHILPAGPAIDSNYTLIVSWEEKRNIKKKDTSSIAPAGNSERVEQYHVVGEFGNASLVRCLPDPNRIVLHYFQFKVFACPKTDTSICRLLCLRPVSECRDYELSCPEGSG